MFALKQEFRSTFRKSPFHLKASEKKNDIERYSDRYQLSQQDLSENWTPGLETLLFSFGSFLTLNLPLYFVLKMLSALLSSAYIQVHFRLEFFMEVNMNPDQTAPWKQSVLGPCCLHYRLHKNISR